MTILEFGRSEHEDAYGDGKDPPLFGQLRTIHSGHLPCMMHGTPPSNGFLAWEWRQAGDWCSRNGSISSFHLGVVALVAGLLFRLAFFSLPTALIGLLAIPVSLLSICAGVSVLICGVDGFVTLREIGFGLDC